MVGAYAMRFFLQITMLTNLDKGRKSVVRQELDLKSMEEMIAKKRLSGVRDSESKLPENECKEECQIVRSQNSKRNSPKSSGKK